MDNEVVVAIECCRDCKSHQWNTRHDQARYQHFFAEFQKEAMAQVGSATFTLNHVPTRFQEADPFKTLNFTEPASDGFQPIRPRIGAFEIYLQSYVSLIDDQCIYSKLATGLWPHIPSVVKKLSKAVEALEEGKDVAQFAVEVRKRGNSVARGSPSPNRNRSNSRSQNITPLRSSYRSPKPFKNASPGGKPPRGPQMIQNNIAIIHGYSGGSKKESNEVGSQSPQSKNSRKNVEQQEAVATKILETKEREQGERRQSNQEKGEERLENDEKLTAEAIETYPESFEQEDQKESLPLLEDNVSESKEAESPKQADAALESSRLVSYEKEADQNVEGEAKSEKGSQAHSKMEEEEKNGQVAIEKREETYSEEDSKREGYLESKEDADEREKEEEKSQGEDAAKEDNDYTSEQEEKRKEGENELRQGEGEALEEQEKREEEEEKEESEEKRDTLEQLPSGKPSKMTINDFKRKESSERYEESFEQSESLNESTVAQRLAMETLDRAKESIKNQMEVQTEAGVSSVSKKATVEEGFESGPLKVEE